MSDEANAPEKGTAIKVGDVAGTGIAVGNGATSLTTIVNQYAAGNSQLTKDQLAAKVTEYLRWVVGKTQNIELRGVTAAGRGEVIQLPLDRAYVPLRAHAVQRAAHEQARMFGARRGKTKQLHAEIGEIDADVETDIALNEVLGLGNRLVILGGPGSGKTTVLLHIAWALASALLSGNDEPARSRLGLDLPVTELPLPIFLSFASFALYRRNLPKHSAPHERTLAYYISHHLIAKQAHFGLPTDFFSQLIANGQNVVLLLDGLDEVANEDERGEVRQSVEDLVCGRPQLRVVVSCRGIAYRSGRTALAAEFREITVQPLDVEPHIAPMVHQAYECIHPRDAVLSRECAADLLEGIAQLEADRRARLGKDAQALVNSPLMVRLLLIVHISCRTLPNDRATLFNKATESLLRADYSVDESDIHEISADWAGQLEMVQFLAYQMHQQGPEQGREIDEWALKEILAKEPDFKSKIPGFIQHARQRGSLVEERDGGYRFIHLAFQEFLVARYLSEVIGTDSRETMLAALTDRLLDPWWREPILLLAGYIASRASWPGRTFISALSKRGTSADAHFCAAELAGSAALEWRESGEEIRHECAQRIVELLQDPAALANSQPIHRARAGAVLGRLGDPRFDPARAYLPKEPLLGFVRIPADHKFRIGTPKANVRKIGKITGTDAYDDEVNDDLTPTTNFYIARYPVTVAQLRVFVQATGFALGDKDALRDPDSSPVRWVNWHEALAYCRWLTDRLQSSDVFVGAELADLIQRGWHLSLPSELEWEKAARGGLQSKVFSWGDEPDPNRANYKDSGIGTVSAAGCFPPNDFGLFDMVGNVWEWTRSLWGTDFDKPEFGYPCRMDEAQRENLKAGDDVFRVVRGGSWHLTSVEARSAFRDWSPPVTRYGNLGLRLVLRPPVRSGL